MESNISKYNLTKEEIDMYREYLKKAKPYTQEEFNELEFDGEYDPDRMDATTANIILNGAEY